ncbi:GNAT family N-acetyltransferase [Defluviimonas salinarum]|uniref:GNAT family N-acetyltransferase n=1 Tax=Defluviimonas salinarum TaxID=2992147 RepID=A0ABT3IZR9_9RHOB|nr:GNAT family N-acetyltransferase [Defluviimonas salinarum]MCW3780908.1 GNAT family N-acetyltransferase [Defluviimonas salinarum]
MDADIRAALPADLDRMGALLTVAFAGDPFARWILPDPHRFTLSNYGYARINAEPGFADGANHIIGDGLGMAIWRPPGVVPDAEALAENAARTFQPDRLPLFQALIEACEPYHLDEPHWHLSLVAVDPVQGGKGLGSRLLAHGLAACDRHGLPVYLESTNRRNLTIYQRHGFELLAEVRIDGAPCRYPMCRPAR